MTPYYRHPEWLAARAQEELVWDAAFVPGLTESIAGIEALPLTPEMFLRLKIGGSPFVCGGSIRKSDVALFLWQVSPRFRMNGRWRCHKFWFVRSLRKKDFKKLARAIFDYIDEAFQDAPGAGRGSKACCSSVAIFAHQFCPKYGRPVEIARMPYKQLFQLRKLMAYEKTGTAPDSPSDQVRAKLRAESNMAGRADLPVRREAKN